ncbi:MAG: PEGA domain-containing protein [Kofleriaceae bacterium]
MGGSRLAVLIAAGLVSQSGVASADPDDEIEMEGDPKPAPKKPDPKPEPKPAPTPDVKPAEPATDPNATVKDPKAAKKWLVTAQQLVQKGDYFVSRKKPDDAKIQYENSLTAFQKALELGDDIAVYYELAVVEDKLGKFDDAAKHWRLVVKAPGMKPDLVKKATAKFDDALTKLGLVTLTVAPQGASITFAGAEIGKAPLPEPLILLPGTYLFSFTADGFQPKETEVKVEAGSESERGIDLEPIKIIVETAKPKEPDVEVPVVEKPPSKLPLYVGGGVAVGLTGVAVITGILAVGKHGTFTDSGSSAGDRDSAQSSGKTFALVTDLTLVGALAAGGFTAYWYFLKYKPAQRKLATESPKVGVAPWVQPSGAGGVTLVGSF